MAKDPNISEKELIKTIRSTLGLGDSSRKGADSSLSESYVIQAKSYNLKTELLSQKTKTSHQELLEGYVNSLNEVSAKLDAVNREDVTPNHFEFRSLKIDEVYNLNAAHLHALYFENISDLQSQLTMDSLTFLRLERDFGSFDDWQKDFIACAMASRNGWVLTVYNTILNRYMNVVVDLHNQHIPINSFPVIVMDCWEHSYYRDYLKDRKTYVHAMMKELNWDVVEKRVQKSERVGKVINSD